jgi:leucyl-tRNA synthetase
MSEKYDPKIIEPKWQKYWEKEAINKADDKDNKRPKFYCLDMFPYPSGDGLHVGHPEGYTATDIYCRFMHMNGYNVLHPMGWDAFGLPAENYAIKKGIHPKETTTKNIARFKKQIQSLGFSYDWDRELNTSDPSYYKWTQWLFLELYKKGLAYQKKAPVNWCDSCQTVLAREQVVDGKCERCKNIVVQKELKQWFFKITNYANELLNDLEKLDWPESIKLMQKNWIGKSEGALIKFKIESEKFKIDESIEVFTTRPDTIFGATYMVLAPEHEIISKLKSQILNFKEVEKYINNTNKKTELERTSLEKTKTGVELKGIHAINPATKKEIPVYIADYVLTSYGTGAIMAVPAHDERDFEFAKKYDLEIKQVIAPYFHVTDGNAAVREDKATIRRPTVYTFLKHHKENKYLCLNWEKYDWHSGIVGGIEKGEDSVEAGIREIKEETGYQNIRFVKSLGGEHHNYYFAAHKDRNTYANGYGLLFELENDEQKPIEKEHSLHHKPVWINAEKMNTWLNLPQFKYLWNALITKSDCFSGNGIMINSGEFDNKKSNEIKDEIIKFVGGKKSTQYRLRDWLISRQRYWGAPIPIIYCDKCGIVPVPESDLPVVLPNDVDFRPTGESPLTRSNEFHNVKCPICKTLAKRESDTMDTFVCSSWYYLRYCDPKNNKKAFDKKKINKWMPVDLYIGGAEHAVMHLLYARFITKALRDLKLIDIDEPFIKLRNQGLILASDGRKMSKSLGNVINPDDVIKEYGADTMRMYEMFMGPLEDAKPWDIKGIIGIKRFLDRVWNLKNQINNKLETKNNDLENIIQNTTKKVTEDIKSLKFNTAISSLMILLNALTKEKEIDVIRYSQFIILISPFAPHLAEEIWHTILKHENSIFLEEWPKLQKVSEQILIIPVMINGKKRSVLEIESAKNLSEKEIIDLAINEENVKKHLINKKIKKTIYISGKILSIVI